MTSKKRTSMQVGPGDEGSALRSSLPGVVGFGLRGSSKTEDGLFHPRFRLISNCLFYLVLPCCLAAVDKNERGDFMALDMDSGCQGQGRGDLDCSFGAAISVFWHLHSKLAFGMDVYQSSLPHNQEPQ